MTKKLLQLIALLPIFCSLNLKAQVTSNAGPDQEICIGDTLKVTGSGLSPGDTGSYQWRKISNNTVLSSKALLSVRILTLNAEEFELKVSKVSMGKTFISYDTFNLKVNNRPSFIYYSIPPICYNNCPYPLSSRLTAIGVAGYDQNIRDSNLNYYQYSKSKNWISKNQNDEYEYGFCNFLINGNVPKAGLRDTICYEYTDPKGCYNRECKPIRINPAPIVELNHGTYCHQFGPITLNNLVVAPINVSGAVFDFKCLSTPTGSGIDPNAIIWSNFSTVPATFIMDLGQVNDEKKPGDYLIEYCFKDAVTGCQTCDTTTVTIIKPAKIHFSSIPKQCINSPLLALDSFASDSLGRRFPFITWKTVEFSGSRDMSQASVANKIMNSVKSEKLFDASLGSGTYMLKATDVSSGCPISDSTIVIVNGLPIVQIDVPDTVCANRAAFALNNINPQGNVGIWSGPGVLNQREFDPSVSAQRYEFEGPYSLKYEYTHPLTGCTSSDSQSILVQSVPQFDINAEVKKVGSVYEVQFELINTSFFDPLDTTIIWFLPDGQMYVGSNPGTITLTDSGEYSIKVGVLNDFCLGTDTLVFTADYRNNTGLNEFQTRLNIFPNPSQGQLNIQCNSEGWIEIHNTNGQLIMKQRIESFESKMDISTLDAGVYTLQFKGENGWNVFRCLIRE